MLKRSFDLLASALGLMALSPLMAVIAVLVKVTSPGPVFFLQERMGRDFRPFLIWKFRTMVEGAPRLGGPITFGADPRITPVGRVLRKLKIDEFPQLVNVLRGDMALVGPRPEVPKYVEMFRDDYAEILRVRPGITDLASIEYLDEAAALGKAEDPEKEYATKVLPAKIKLAKMYVAKASLAFDLTIMFKTLLRLVVRRSPAPAADAAVAQKQPVGKE